MASKKDSGLSLTIAIVLSLFAPSFVLVQAIMVSNSYQASAAVSMAKDDTVAERIRPVVTLDDIRGPADEQQMAAGATAVAAKTPASLYQGACLACHAAGVANAPKLGDRAAWAPKAALGVDALTQSVINGKGVMPPKGGSAYTDEELRSIVEYMLAEAGL